MRASLRAAAMVLGAIVLWMIIPSSEDRIMAFVRSLMFWARWILLVAGGVWIAYNIVVWRTAEFTVTNLRVLRNEGLIQRRSSETMLTAGSDVKMKDQIDSRPVSAPATVAAPQPVAAAHAPAPVAAAHAPAEDQAATLIKLAELRDSGVITPEEFEAKKTEILARM